MGHLLTRLLTDETGAEPVEYALIFGLIIIAAIAVIGTVGTKAVARWTAISSAAN